MDYYNDGKNCNKYSSDEIELEKLLEEQYKNPLEEDYIYILCTNCGERLYEGDIYYPEIGLCEYCLPNYKERVEIE